MEVEFDLGVLTVSSVGQDLIGCAGMTPLESSSSVLNNVNTLNTGTNIKTKPLRVFLSGSTQTKREDTERIAFVIAL